MRETIVKAWPFVVALGVAGAIWQWGYMVGDGKSDQLVELLKEQNRTLGDDARRSSAENESLKIQLQRSADSPATGEIHTATIEQPAQPNSSGSTRIQVSAQSTEELYGGDLLITLVATDFTGSPSATKLISRLDRRKTSQNPSPQSTLASPLRMRDTTFAS